MTHQQRLLWEKLTEKVRLAGMDNLHARELYDEMCKLMDMENSEKNVIISISDTGEGLEVKINEMAYGNLAIVGLLERIKTNILLEDAPEVIINPLGKSGNYDA